MTQALTESLQAQPFESTLQHHFSTDSSANDTPLAEQPSIRASQASEQCTFQLDHEHQCFILDSLARLDQFCALVHFCFCIFPEVVAIRTRVKHENRPLLPSS